MTFASACGQEQSYTLGAGTVEWNASVDDATMYHCVIIVAYVHFNHANYAFEFTDTMHHGSDHNTRAWTHVEKVEWNE
eukprot:m.49795 g.49795  ORF g.49795 m.49795 type:complete len:78 (+) comp11122_c0_seq1:629-862(+)